MKPRLNLPGSQILQYTRNAARENHNIRYVTILKQLQIKITIAIYRLFREADPPSVKQKFPNKSKVKTLIS